jgi:hypothetical protein
VEPHSGHAPEVARGYTLLDPLIDLALDPGVFGSHLYLARKFPGPDQSPELDATHADASGSEVIVVQEVNRAAVPAIIITAVTVGVTAAAMLWSSFRRVLHSNSGFELRGASVATFLSSSS